MVKRKKYQIKNIIEIEEYHDGRYGAPGSRREKKKKATKEQMERVNQYNKEKNARRRLLKYFEPERDWFLTLTYRKEERPPDMKTAKLHFKRFLDVVRREYKKRGVTLYWIRNIENTATNNWHIHLVLSDIPDMNILVLLKKAWPYGRVKDPQQLYERDQMRTLAAYVTKSEKTRTYAESIRTAHDRREAAGMVRNRVYWSERLTDRKPDRLEESLGSRSPT